MAIWILDASHGGNDPGILGGSLGKRESDIVLEAVLEAKRHLERNGETVVLTREYDEDVTLEQRIKVAKESEGKYFISFKMNSHIDKNNKGVQTYYLKEDADNQRLARLIRDEIFSGLRTEDNGVYKDVKKVYAELNLPGVLVYGDYLTNENVEESFNGKRYGILVAKACLAMVDKVLLLTPVTKPKKMQKRAFRICIGYYKDFNTAMDVLQELRDKGLKNAHVVPYDGD